LKQYPTLAVATVIDAKGSSPRGIGAKMVIFPDGDIFDTVGGGALEKKVIEDALDAMASGSSFTRTYDLAGKDKDGVASICGGKASVYVEIIRSPDTLLICGGGHVAQALASLAGAIGLNLVVVEDRKAYASKERFPAAQRVLNVLPSDPQVRDLVTPSTYVVILTHSHELDKAVLKNLVVAEAAYIGMIGSIKKVRFVLDELKKEGLPTEALDRIYSPVGLNIGAETPSEIAISILSEIIHVRRKRCKSPISMKITPLPETSKK
jgi:xanthine dehydrogenase accessory factor